MDLGTFCYILNIQKIDFLNSTINVKLEEEAEYKCPANEFHVLPSIDKFKKHILLFIVIEE